MRIGINGLLLSSEAGYRQSGIDRYIRGLLSELPEAMVDDELVVYAETGTIDPDGFELHPAPSFTRNRALRIAWEQAGLPTSDSQRSLRSLPRNGLCVAVPVAGTRRSDDS